MYYSGYYLGITQVPVEFFSLLLLVLLLFWFIAYYRGTLKALFILSILLAVLNIPVILSIPSFFRTLFIIGSTTFLGTALFLDFACFILGVGGIIKSVRG